MQDEDRSIDIRSGMSISLTAAVLIICGLLAAFHIILFSGFIVDDAFISFRYAENFAEGKGLVFNDGERVEGYSNFLWVLMLGLLKKAGVSVILASKALGLISLLSIILIAYRLVIKITGEAVYAAGVLILLVTSFGLQFYAVTGMETVFYSALLTLGGYIFFNSGGRISLSLTLVAFAITVTRPEGMLFFAILVIMDLVGSRQLGGRLIRSVVLFAAMSVLFLLWRYSYYGDLLPNTFYAKPMRATGSLPPVISGFDDIFEFFTFNGGPLFLVLVSMLILSNEARKRIYPLLAVPAAVMIFQLYSGGDWMEGYRFLVPMLPIYLALGIYGIWRLLERANVRVKPAVLLGGAMLLGLFNLGETAFFYLKRDEYPNFIMTSKDLIPASKWVGENYPPEYKIMCWRIGALAYYSRMNLIDVSWGLTDRYVARMIFRGEWDKEANKAYIFKRNPELFMTASVPGVSLAETHEFGGRQYRLVRDFRQGSKELWVLYERMGPD